MFAMPVLTAGVPVAFEPSIRVTHAAHESEWIRSQFEHSKGAGAFLVLRSSVEERAVWSIAIREVAGITAKGVRAAARLHFRDAAGRFAAVAGILHGAFDWWRSDAGNQPRATEPGAGDLGLVPLD